MNRCVECSICLKICSRYLLDKICSNKSNDKFHCDFITDNCFDFDVDSLISFLKRHNYHLYIFLKITGAFE